jgi:hypothetical protein
LSGAVAGPAEGEQEAAVKREDVDPVVAGIGHVELVAVHGHEFRADVLPWRAAVAGERGFPAEVAAVALDVAGVIVGDVDVAVGRHRNAFGLDEASRVVDLPPKRSRYLPLAASKSWIQPCVASLASSLPSLDQAKSST